MSRTTSTTPTVIDRPDAPCVFCTGRIGGVILKLIETVNSEIKLAAEFAGNGKMQSVKVVLTRAHTLLKCLIRASCTSRVCQTVRDTINVVDKDFSDLMNIFEIVLDCCDETCEH